MAPEWPYRKHRKHESVIRGQTDGWNLEIRRFGSTALARAVDLRSSLRVCGFERCAQKLRENVAPLREAAEVAGCGHNRGRKFFREILPAHRVYAFMHLCSRRLPGPSSLILCRLIGVQGRASPRPNALKFATFNHPLCLQILSTKHSFNLNE